jgi:serine protease Do
MRKSVSLIFATAIGSLIGLLAFSKKQPTIAEAQPKAPVATATPAPPANPARATQPVVPVPGAPASFVDLVKRARTSVVNIHSLTLIKQRPVAVPFGEDSPFYRLVQPPDEKASSLGSGVIISPDGDIVTNNHVIAPEEMGGRVADQIDVLLDDKRQFRAKVVARDPQTDVALLHIQALG